VVSGTVPNRLEIKPRRIQNAVSQILFCLLMIALCVALIYTGRISGIVIGILGVAFCGFISLSAVIKAFQKNSTMTLSENGIELQKDFGRVLIRWKNVEDIGSCGGYSRMIGIKIKSYDEYLAYIPPDKTDEIMGKHKIQKIFMFIGYLFISLYRIPSLKEEGKFWVSGNGRGGVYI
jgi:hypothetical protein